MAQSVSDADRQPDVAIETSRLTLAAHRFANWRPRMLLKVRYRRVVLRCCVAMVASVVGDFG